MGSISYEASNLQANGDHLPNSKYPVSDPVFSVIQELINYRPGGVGSASRAKMAISMAGSQ